MSNDIDKMIENLNKGCYVGDIDLEPDYVPELSEEDLKQTTVEKE